MRARSADIAAVIEAHGGICHLSALMESGISPDRVQRAARSAMIVRLRTGWYAAGAVSPEAAVAIRSGGALTCVSALHLRGAWALDDRLLHVRVRRGTRVPQLTGVRTHWNDGAISVPVDTPIAAAQCVLRCLPEEHAIATLDSALHLGLIDFEDLDDSNPRAQRVIARLDRTSESGLESLARVRLRRRGIRVRTQVRIPTVGRVDLLIGDRLILELDGERWHAFEDDRARDRRAAVMGYVTMRASYRQVLFGWPELEGELLTLIRRGEHRWRGSAARSHENRIPVPRAG